jgi:hypothetical protein
MRASQRQVEVGVCVRVCMMDGSALHYGWTHGSAPVASNVMQSYTLIHTYSLYISDTRTLKHEDGEYSGES